MAQRARVSGKVESNVEKVRTLRRPKASPRAECAIEARLEATSAATERLIGAVNAGSRDYVISSSDGRVSARVRLTIARVSRTEHHVAAGRILVDWSRGVVENGNSHVSLSRTELRLLAALLAGEGRPMSRQRLIEQVWPVDELEAADRANALAVYICSLRKRLNSVGVGGSLETVRGVGYRVAFSRR